MNLIKEYGLKVDERFAQSGKEAVKFMISWVILSIWVWAWASFGASHDPATYTYIMGMPMWFFMVGIVTIIIYPVYLIISAVKMKDCSLTGDGTEPVDYK